jgi:hypothetical protein
MRSVEVVKWQAQFRAFKAIEALAEFEMLAWRYLRFGQSCAYILMPINFIAAPSSFYGDCRRIIGLTELIGWVFFLAYAEESMSQIQATSEIRVFHRASCEHKDVYYALLRTLGISGR